MNAKDSLGCLVPLVYLGMGLLQLAAIVGGIEDWWGWPWWAAIVLAVPVAYLPVIGTVVAIMGAIRSFEWSPWVAVAVFCWPYLVYGILLASGGLASVFHRNRGS